ncbi:hypothetical protein Ancab_007368 [Ancistrocladus abbreviatus]
MLVQTRRMLSCSGTHTPSFAGGRSCESSAENPGNNLYVTGLSTCIIEVWISISLARERLGGAGVEHQALVDTLV